MPLQLYDTRKRRKIPFKPLTAGRIKMYTCGPTVYEDATIGNLRAYMFEDLLRRSLKFLGFEVTQVMNITDVDDKTIREASERNIPLKEVTSPVIERFFNDLELLSIEPAEHYPLATDHIPEIIELIEILYEKGYAYEMEGSIYFSIEKFADYGQLSGMKIDKLIRQERRLQSSDARIDADEYQKGDFRDFALWKGWTEEDADIYWDSPFGRGRPGWHIECSAMARKYLGDQFDIHTGGIDNIFPHHENEIAQSVAATGKSFARHWMHCAHLMIEGQKMSKSLGNVYLLKDLLQKGYSPRAVRYILLVTHYRQTLNFTHRAVEAAARSLERLDTLYQAANLANGGGRVRSGLQDALDTARVDFTAALEDDLGISEALAALFKLVSRVHQLEAETALNKAEGGLIKVFWADADRVLGFLIHQRDLPLEVIDAVRERIEFRQMRRFEDADRIRDELAVAGFQLEDISDGTVVIWLGGRKIVTNKINNS